MTTLAESYARCRELNKRFGKTYYLATFFLPAWKRRHVHALYGFARYADDIVDDLGATATTEARAVALAELGARFFTDLECGRSEHPVLKAVVHTVRAFAVDPDEFRYFFASMTADLTIDRYETWDDLLGYMRGSAAAIGMMMAPILEYESDAALPPAMQLGNAFQLTNFLRDIDEDLQRSRQYVPQEDLARFGVDLRARRCDDAFRALMRFEIARNRALYDAAEPGIALLTPSSRPCIRLAHELYSGILTEIEDADYDVFDRRAVVPMSRKLAAAARTRFRMARRGAL